MSVRLVCCFLTGCLILSGCQNADSPAAQLPGANANATASKPAPGHAPVIDSQPAPAGSDPQTVDAMPARELTLSWVGDVGALRNDPLDLKQIRIRGEVVRITPTRWFNAQHLTASEAAVWLYGEAADWSSGREIWIECEFGNSAAVEHLRSGQMVAIEGRYRRSPGKGNILIDKCRLLAAGRAPDDAPEGPPPVPLSELQEIGKRLQEFNDTNRLPMRISITGGGLLVLELQKKLFAKTDTFPQRALNAVTALPIGAVECPGEAAAQFLAVAGRFPRLRELTINGTLNCTPADFVQLKQLQYLESLELKSCDSIDDDLAAAIGELKSLRALEIGVGFQRYELTDAGLVSIAALDNLRSLKFDSDDKITNESIIRIVELRHLRRLAVRNTSSFGSSPLSGDSGLAAISPESLPELRILDLNGQTNVTDAAIETLIGQKRHLAAIDLGGTGVTDAGLERILESKLADRVVSVPSTASDDIKFRLIEAGMSRER